MQLAQCGSQFIAASFDAEQEVRANKRSFQLAAQQRATVKSIYFRSRTLDLVWHFRI